MEFSPLLLQWLMIVLLVIAIIGILCFITLLVGLFIIYRYFKKVALYTARIKGVVDVWESIPKTLLNLILEYIPSPRSDKKMSRK